MQSEDYQILSLSQLRRSHRSILGKVEQIGARFIITDADAVVGELGPLTRPLAETDPGWNPADGRSSPPPSD